MYSEWIQKKNGTHTSITAAILKLNELHTRYGDLYLVCWFAPLACHGDVLKEMIES